MRDAIIDGKRYVNLLDVTKFCKMCVKHKIADHCLHGLKWMSTDTNTDLQNKIAMLYEDKNLRNVEIFGLDPEMTAQAIDPVMIDKFVGQLDHEYVNMNDPNIRCFIACDPNNGGANHTAFVAAVTNGRNIKVLFLWFFCCFLYIKNLYNLGISGKNMHYQPLNCYM